MILAALLGFGTGEIVDNVTQEECAECNCITCPSCPDARVIAYVNDCDTGETDKYFGECIGASCSYKSTEEILSETFG